MHVEGQGKKPQPPQGDGPYLRGAPGAPPQLQPWLGEAAAQRWCGWPRRARWFASRAPEQAEDLSAGQAGQGTRGTQPAPKASGRRAVSPCTGTAERPAASSCPNGRCSGSCG